MKKNRCKGCEYEADFVCPGDIYKCMREVDMPRYVPIKKKNKKDKDE